MRIYLDNSSLNRQHDDQSIDRNQFEADAVLAVLRLVERGEAELVWSEVIDIEANECREARRREAVDAARGLRDHLVRIRRRERLRAAELNRLGFQVMDAAHIACAESANCDALLTTDDKMMRRAKRLGAKIRVRLVNPLDWIREARQP
jgi:predicted nucleic acid-binding protein